MDEPNNNKFFPYCFGPKIVIIFNIYFAISFTSQETDYFISTLEIVLQFLVTAEKQNIILFLEKKQKNDINKGRYRVCP